MRFILGYIPGSVSRQHPGPKVFWEINSDWGGKRYTFERLERVCHGVHKDCKSEACLFVNKLRIYESDDYPPEVLRNLFETKQLVPWPLIVSPGK